DAFLRALDLQRAGNDAAHGTNLAPLFRQPVVAPGGRRLRKSFEMYGFSRRAVTRGPCFLRGEAEHRREPGDGATEQMIEHGEAGLARGRRIRIAIECVLADVEIECREVRGHEDR